VLAFSQMGCRVGTRTLHKSRKLQIKGVNLLRGLVLGQEDACAAWLVPGLVNFIAALRSIHRLIQSVFIHN